MDEMSFAAQFSQARDTIYAILQQTNSYNPDVVGIMIEVFKPYPDLTTHGPILWALMVQQTGVCWVIDYSILTEKGVKKGVLGSQDRKSVV